MTIYIQKISNAKQKWKVCLVPMVCLHQNFKYKNTKIKQSHVHCFCNRFTSQDINSESTDSKLDFRSIINERQKNLRRNQREHFKFQNVLYAIGSIAFFLPFTIARVLHIRCIIPIIIPITITVLFVVASFFSFFSRCTRLLCGVIE